SRTVEIHRGRVMEKMQVDSLSDLVRLGVLTQLY
ncbi:MAG: DNA-binding response regulator, partial [Gammaproteobacteria bacterium]|nr:DNA-binding response regulator [Gammaproteobacteria bacterium]